MQPQDMIRLKTLEQKRRDKEVFSDEEYKEFAKLMVERVNEFIDDIWP